MSLRRTLLVTNVFTTYLVPVSCNAMCAIYIETDKVTLMVILIRET